MDGMGEDGVGEDGMASTTFDTLRAARDLEAAGVERKQAEAHAEALRQAATADRDELATGADLDNLASRLEAGIADLRAAVASVEGRIYRALWIQGGVIVAIPAGLKLLA